MTRVFAACLLERAGSFCVPCPHKERIFCMEPRNQPSASDRRACLRWVLGTLLLTVTLLCLFAAPTAYIDPLFHYHAPLEQYQYPIHDERYQNDGITRHFDYDSIITGTSMTENFKTSEADALFDANFIKVPFAGGYFREIDQNLRRAYASGHDLRYVIRGLDPEQLFFPPDFQNPGFSFPGYLYNDDFFDDLHYLLNKAILFDYTLAVPAFTRAGSRTPTFDEYANWSSRYSYGASSAMRQDAISDAPPPETAMTEEDRALLEENVRQNVAALAQEHPETTFYYFFSPFSIIYWGRLYNNGAIQRQVEAEQAVIELLVDLPNVRLYSFNNNFDLICGLDNYKDYEHYGEWVNSWILEQFQSDEYRLTRDNYRDYLEEIRRFYTTYDYPSLNLLK